MDKKTKQMVEGGFRKGVLKTSVANIEKIISRTADTSGKIYGGEAGRNLRRRKLERQAYAQRNRAR